MTATQQCAKCGDQKSRNDFHKEARARNGLHSYCRACYSEYQRNRYQNKPPITNEQREIKKQYDIAYRQREQVVERDKNRRKLNYLTPLARAKNLLNGARQRARISNRQFNVSLEYIHVIILLGKCQKSGISFDLSHINDKLYSPFAPSIDRIDNQEGYTNDNIQIVCTMFNMGKGQAVEADFIAMCCAVAERYRNDATVIARLAELRA